jgi:hypothetical protein
MAVVQISRIQHRRGLQQDLPQLASAELGWSVDQRRLFIGNGDVTEGAPTLGRTEILTEYTDILALANTYTFKGLPSGFVAITGADNISVVRSLQEKLDDFVNVRDFGAKGDGNTDDTSAINRALNNTYAYSNYFPTVNHRRIIYFPAGKYKVTGEISVPPYIKLQGEGKLSTVIEATRSSETEAVFKLYDSASQPSELSLFGDQVGSISPMGANYVFSDMSIVNLAESAFPCVEIPGGKNISFNRVSLGGALTTSTSDRGTGCSAVYVTNTSTEIPLDNLIFNECDFLNHGYGVEILNPETATGVSFTNCKFENLYRAIVSDQLTGLATTACRYYTVEIVNFNSFENSHGTSIISEGKTILMAGNTTSATSLGITNLPSEYTSVEISYTIKQDTNYRTGVFKASTLGSSYQDEYVENIEMDIVLSANTSTGDIEYTSLGNDSQFTYTIKHFNI